MAQIVNLTGCAESSIREWVQGYKRDGLAGLYARSAQNARKLTARQRAELHDWLHTYRPDQVLSRSLRVGHGQFWTVSDLHLALQQWYGVVYEDPGTYRALFHQCALSYQRAERVYKSRPSEAEIADFEAALENK